MSIACPKVDRDKNAPSDLGKENFSRFADVFRALSKDNEKETEQPKKEGEHFKHQDEL